MASSSSSSWHRPCEIDHAAATVRQLKQGDNDVRFPFPVFLNSSSCRGLMPCTGVTNIRSHDAQRGRPLSSSHIAGTIVKKPIYKVLYVQVIVAIIIGIALGHFYPNLAVDMKPLGDGFIKLIKMVIGPIIFCTVVTGIAGMEDMKKVGRVGGKALLYFEIVSTLRAGARPDRHARAEAGRRLQHRPGHARRQGGRVVRRQGARPDDRRLPDAHHSGHARRRLSRKAKSCRSC